mmetsp:Transcript_3952/g.8727  ORF Transcript_3952/g.8727 Transcript_3952/m.8727 type:complete len:1199 (-) Transcript_3952:9-3605(-)
MEYPTGQIHAVLLVGVAIFTAVVARPTSCELGGLSVLTQKNAWCVGNASQGWSATKLADECCADKAGKDTMFRQLVSQNSPNQAECRYISTDQAYCDPVSNPGCENYIGANDLLELYVDMTAESNEDSCCQNCFCYGDPECTAFNGARDEWVVCDGLRGDNCRQGRKACRRTKDHAGNRCKWLKDYKNMDGHPLQWKGWVESGSPCQPDFNASGYPTMNMYSVNDFSLDLQLGERGVITKASLGTNTGTYSITAADCFANDPRINSSNPFDAWTTTDTIPADWTVSEPNGVEIAWDVSDLHNGVYLQILCTRSFFDGQPGLPRLNIQRLIETQDHGAGDGFCVSGKINKMKTLEKHAIKTHNLHMKCLAQNLESSIVACKKLVDDTCSTSSKKRFIRKWCNQADTGRMTNVSSPAECFEYLTSSSESETVMRWTTMVCEANGLDVEQCITEISQFGWDTFLSVHTNGLVPLSLTPTSCVNNADFYGKRESNCQRGVNVEYFDEVTNAWEELFFIPSNRPPCNNRLQLSGDKYEQLFTHKIRLAQCDLDSTCLVKNTCIPTVGFSVKTRFSSSSCPTSAPTKSPTMSPTKSPTKAPSKSPTEAPSASPTVSPTKAPTTPVPTASPTTPIPTKNPTTSPTTIFTLPPPPGCYKCSSLPEQHTQTICDADPRQEDLGSCMSCCDKETIYEHPSTVREEKCRAVELNRPYCDMDDPDQRGKCDKLPTSNGKLTLTVAVDETEQECCKQCSCWGDPECSAFDGSLDKWILCESRTSRCKTSESVCATQKDHAGNQCAWDSAIANKIRFGPDIGAYGSPCQPRWDLAPVASMDMYTTDSFEASIEMGERGVIEKLVLTTFKGTADESKNALVANDCFAVDPNAAWRNMYGASANIALDLSITEGPGEDERGWTIVDQSSGIFIKLTCIRQRARDGFIGGHRMNIQQLIETDMTPKPSAGGYCVVGKINTQNSTTNLADPIFNACMNNMPSAHLACKALWQNSCSKDQIPTGVMEWCKMANVFPGDPEAASKCYNQINPSDSNLNHVGARMAELYCKAVKKERPVGMTYKTWIRQCTTRIETDGWRPVVQEFGAGTFVDDVKSPCGRSEEQYFKRLDTEYDVYGGISVQYFQNGTWNEEFFIPENFPVCNNQLEITAANHQNLFTHRVRFQQCTGGTDYPKNLACMGNQGFDIGYKFSQDTAICQ